MCDAIVKCRLTGKVFVAEVIVVVVVAIVVVVLVVVVCVYMYVATRDEVFLLEYII